MEHISSGPFHTTLEPGCLITSATVKIYSSLIFHAWELSRSGTILFQKEPSRFMTLMDSSINQGLYFALATLKTLEHFSSPRLFLRLLIFVVPMKWSTIASKIMQIADCLGDSLLLCNLLIVGSRADLRQKSRNRLKPLSMQFMPQSVMSGGTLQARTCILRQWATQSLSRDN